MPIVGDNQCDDAPFNYPLRRFELSEDCDVRQCINPVDLTIHGLIQPMRLSRMSDLDRSAVGDRVDQVYVIHYEATAGAHTGQVPGGLFVRMSDSKFLINGYDAGIGGGCSDLIQHLGQWWKPVQTHFSPSLCSAGYMGRALLCLHDCDQRVDPSIADPIDGLYIPAPV